MFSFGNLTSRQKEVLEFINQFSRQNGGSPTYREIAHHFKFRGPKAATDHVSALERKGYVRRRKGRARGIEVLISDDIPGVIPVPILGAIRAGAPEEQSEDARGILAVDQTVLGNCWRHRLFAIQISGGSMEGRGIHDGDWVVADADDVPREGDIVVALIDGKNTLKTLAKRKQRFFLKAENPKHSDLIPEQELSVQGVVRAVIRQMR